jgi:hypothetical protein
MTSSAYQQAWVRPENATLVIVGDTTLAEIVPMLDKHLGDWKAEGPAPSNGKIAQVALPKQPRVYLIDQPGAVQANLYVGQVMPSSKDPGAIKLEFANAVLGGEFSSRLNMNLREDKHWAYGSYSFVQNAQGQRPWMAFAAVQIDKTAESLAEMRREITDYADGKAPPKPEEVEKMQNTEIRGLPGSYETAGSVMSTIGGIVRYGRPDDYVLQRKTEVEGPRRGAGGRGREGDRSVGADVGGGRRPVEDRATGARAEPRRSHDRRCGRQAGKVVGLHGQQVRGLHASCVIGHRSRCRRRRTRHRFVHLGPHGPGCQRGEGGDRPAGGVRKAGRGRGVGEGQRCLLRPHPLRVQEELETLARNEAPGLGAGHRAAAGPAERGRPAVRGLEVRRFPLSSPSGGRGL